MTNRVHSLTVALAEDMRVDDVEGLVNAILRLRSVISVGTRSGPRLLPSSARTARLIIEEIGPLLDAWEGLCNDEKFELREEWSELCKYLDRIAYICEFGYAPEVLTCKK